jgi:hypothetical protein
MQPGRGMYVIKVIQNERRNKMLTRKMIIGMIVAVLSSMSTTAWGIHYYVDKNGDDSNGLSWATAFNTIQQGIDANDATIVEVNEGTYYETVDFNGVACTLTSTDPYDDDVVAATIIDANCDANNTGRVVTFDNGEDANSILTGFTITGGYANGSSYPAYMGGGIYCYIASPTIDKCIIIDNKAGVYGGGVCNYYGACPTVTNCIFAKNSTIGNGQWGGYGGGICNLVNSVTTLTNCTFSGNAAYIDNNGGYGGAMLNHTSSPYITNCIFWDDYADNGGNEIYNFSSDPNFSYCDIEGCKPGSVWDPNFGTNGGGNIDSDPLFVDDANDDYHLDPNSPCIDAGDPNTDPNDVGLLDLDGNDRFVDGDGDSNDVIDMGCYEYDPNS